MKKYINAVSRSYVLLNVVYVIFELVSFSTLITDL